MKRIARLVLLYLLALALPVQGWAAAMQSVCAPSATGMAMLHEAHGMPNVQIAAAPAMVHEHHVHDAHQHADATHAMPDHATGSDGKLGSIGCSACAACYVGMALLPVMPELAMPTHVSSPIVVAPATHFLGHIPDSPRRPPRSVSV